MFIGVSMQLQAVFNYFLSHTVGRLPLKTNKKKKKTKKNNGQWPAVVISSAPPPPQLFPLTPPPFTPPTKQHHTPISCPPPPKLLHTLPRVLAKASRLTTKYGGIWNGIWNEDALLNCQCLTLDHSSQQLQLLPPLMHDMESQKKCGQLLVVSSPTPQNKMNGRGRGAQAKFYADVAFSIPEIPIRHSCDRDRC